MIIAAIISIVIFTVALARVLFRKQNRPPVKPINQAYKNILSEYVPFYRELNPLDKTVFENRMMIFLSSVQITGIHTTVEDMDTVFIAASAIIPIFGFPDWEYPNLKEVLLYPDSFDHESFNMKSDNRNTLGVVGTYALHNVMILSKLGLRDSFINKTGKTNVPVHEFAHLIDKTDGEIDGIPESIMSRQYVIPWLELMQKTMQEIRDGHSDIDPYGITNQAEFFAVVSEYFFERPDLLEDKHPELYELLSTIFKQNPKVG